MSAESGVPTFRDVETGLWAKVDPYEISSSEGWQANPERVWAWYLWRHYMMGSVGPNDGHRAVAAWQDFADVHVVTQNVDNLHERAGSKNVYHLHGSLFEFRCDRCQSAYSGELPAMAEPVEAVDPPRCACGGLIRPNVVWFGEALPDDEWQRSIDAVAGADLVGHRSCSAMPVRSRASPVLVPGSPTGRRGRCTCAAASRARGARRCR